jgi:hypothetical protein
MLYYFILPIKLNINKVLLIYYFILPIKLKNYLEPSRYHIITYI